MREEQWKALCRARGLTEITITPAGAPGGDENGSDMTKNINCFRGNAANGTFAFGGRIRGEATGTLRGLSPLPEKPRF